jgi:hypothetical protein
MSKNIRPTAFEFSTLVGLIQEAETYARSIQAHEAARALNAAKNTAGTARADQLGDGGAARRYAAKRTAK